MAQAAQFYDCPSCHHLTPFPVSIDQPPVCVNCIQGEWPDDPPSDWATVQWEYVAFFIALAFFIGAVLSKLGYL